MNKRLLHSLRLCLISRSEKRVSYLQKHHIFGCIGEKSIWRDRLIPLYADHIYLGNNVRCGSRVYFITHDVIHSMLNNREDNDFEFKEKIGEIRIGDNVFIGSNTSILYDVTIGSNVIIGACSLVNKSIPSNSVWAGVPAKYICSFDEFVQKRKKQSVNSEKREEGILL